MYAVRTAAVVGFCLAVVVGLAVPAGGAPWFRDFHDGTLQDLDEFDLAWTQGRDGFNPTNVDSACRLLFVAGDGEDTAVLFDDDDVFVDTTAKLLIKWPTNPTILVKNGAPAINVGLLVRGTIDLEFYQFKAYAALINDEGEMLLVKIAGLASPDLCTEGGEAVVPDFDPSVNWWLKGEAVDVPGGVRIRARAWAEGTPEPEIWHVQCIDPADVAYRSGVAGTGAQEEAAADQSSNLSYVDIDDLSAGPSPEYRCFNNIDDDGDSLIDCADPDCDPDPACACHDPFADADGDDDVDQVDFALFQACFTGSNPGGSIPAACECFDREDANADGFFNPPDDGNQDVNGTTDLDKFEACATGPGIAADPACDNVNY